MVRHIFRTAPPKTAPPSLQPKPSGLAPPPAQRMKSVVRTPTPYPHYAEGQPPTSLQPPAPRPQYPEQSRPSSPAPTPIPLPHPRPRLPPGPLICLYNPADAQPIRYVAQSRPPPGYTPVEATGSVYPPIFEPERRDSSTTTVIWSTTPGRRVMVQSGVYSPLLTRAISMPRQRRSSVTFIPTSQTRYDIKTLHFAQYALDIPLNEAI